MAAAEAGARGITHLFNAMTQLQHRAPGVVGAALDHGGLWCGIIADGHHVHPAALARGAAGQEGTGAALPGDRRHADGGRCRRRLLPQRPQGHAPGRAADARGRHAGRLGPDDGRGARAHAIAHLGVALRRGAAHGEPLSGASSSASTTGADGSRPAFAPTSSISTIGSASRPCGSAAGRPSDQRSASITAPIACAVVDGAIIFGRAQRTAHVDALVAPGHGAAPSLEGGEMKLGGSGLGEDARGIAGGDVAARHDRDAARRRARSGRGSAALLEDARLLTGGEQPVDCRARSACRGPLQDRARRRKRDGR